MMLDRCQYGRTGISPGKAMCEARQVQGSLFCGPHRSEAIERAPSVVAKRMQHRWSPPQRGMRG